MTKKTSSRKTHLDSVHGLMILNMMLTHWCGFAIGMSSKFYYPVTHVFAFYMTWFFFKSGMFAKDISFKEETITDTRKLLLPALFYTILGYILIIIIQGFKFNILDEITLIAHTGTPNGNGPMWFLFSLFVIKLLFFALKKCKIHPLLIILISFVLILVTKHFCSSLWWSLNISIGLFFYALGYLFRDWQYNRNIALPALAIYVLFLFFHSNIDLRIGQFDPFFLTIFWSIAACIAFNYLFFRFTKINIKPLQFVGRHAMAFYPIHYMVLLCIQAIVSHFSFDRYPAILCYATIFALYIIVTILILRNTQK